MPLDWENIFTVHIPDKEPVYRLSKKITSMDCSLPGSSVHGILQERILEWVTFPFSRGSSWPRDRTWVFCIAGRFFIIWATREAQRILRTQFKKKGKMFNFKMGKIGIGPHPQGRVSFRSLLNTRPKLHQLEPQGQWLGCLEPIKLQFLSSYRPQNFYAYSDGYIWPPVPLGAGVAWPSPKHLSL